MKTTDLPYLTYAAACSKHKKSVSTSGCTWCELEDFRAKVAALEEERDALSRALDDAKGEALSLACALYNQHYTEDAPDWAPLDTAAGVITQINNMVAGLSQDNDYQFTRANEWREQSEVMRHRAEVAEQQAQRMREALEKIAACNGQDIYGHIAIARAELEGK